MMPTELASERLVPTQNQPNPQPSGVTSSPLPRRERWAVVTGASSGIGKAAALELARHGFHVALHYRQSQAATETVAAAIQEMGQATVCLMADFTDPNAGPAFVDAVWQATGGVWAWFHNAGADVLTTEAAHWPFERKLGLLTTVDLWGTMLVCRTVGAKMFANGGGVIVTMGWDQALTGMEGDNGEIFAAIKGGVMAFSRSLAKSLAPMVRVNNVAPGWVRTAWAEQASSEWQRRACAEALLKRFGTPTDIAHAVAYLCSDQAAFITGQTWLVNGGVVTS